VNISILVYTGSWGGAQLHTTSLLKTLAGRGHTLTIVELGRDRYAKSLDPYIDCAQVVPFPGLHGGGRSIGWIEAWRLVRRLPRDVCVLVKSDFEIGNWKLDWVARFWFKYYITIEHMNPPSMPAKTSRRYLGGLIGGVGLWWFKVFLQRWARSLGPHLIVTVSDVIRQSLIAVYRFPSRKILTMPSGTDTAKFAPNREYRRRWRAARRIPEGAIIFGAVGRLDEVKGYEIAVEQFILLSRQLPHRDMWLVLVGEGPLEGKLKSAAAAGEFADRILFESFTEQPWEVYPAFDLFIMPSRTEGLPFALLEAMACGCPPIAMEVGTIPYLVTNSLTGWLVAPGDRQGFFAAMMSAAETAPERLVEIGLTAREKILTDFQAKPLFARLADLVERCGDRGNAASRTRLKEAVER